MTGGQVSASNSSYVVCYIRGQDEDGKPFLLTDPLGTGFGGRPYTDGNDAIYLVANDNYPVEFLEGVYPVVINRYALSQDSGGAGRWRGGCGVVREYEILAPEAPLGIRIDRVKFPPWALRAAPQATA
jgi:N-methylhydantoinase B